MKTIYFNIILIISFAYCVEFPAGTRTLGGSFGYFKDFNADVSIFQASPRFGYFIIDNLILECGFSYININNDDDNSLYEGHYLNGYQNARAFGLKVFLEGETVSKFYLGFEFLQGFISSIESSMGNGFINNIEQFNGDSDRGLVKIGLLTPISSELYLDSSFNYMFILDKDIREQDIELAEVGYISVGLSYFWKK